MDQVLQDFLVFLREEYRYSENTVAAYRNDLTQFYEFLTRRPLSGPQGLGGNHPRDHR